VINIKNEITAEHLKECSAAGKSISETVWAQLAVIPSLSMRREVRKWFGFYRKDAKSGDDKDAEYREGKMLMYGKEEINRLKEFGTTPFKEVIMGCRIDSHGTFMVRLGRRFIPRCYLVSYVGLPAENRPVGPNLTYRPIG
jgi:hypothetical protein